MTAPLPEPRGWAGSLIRLAVLVGGIGLLAGLALLARAEVPAHKALWNTSSKPPPDLTVTAAEWQAEREALRQQSLRALMLTSGSAILLAVGLVVPSWQAFSRFPLEPRLETVREPFAGCLTALLVVLLPVAAFVFLVSVCSAVSR
jgi:hypothetical protein